MQEEFSTEPVQILDRAKKFFFLIICHSYLFIYTYSLITDTTKRFTFMYLTLFMIRPKLFVLIAHATGWILFFSLMIAFVSGVPGNQNIMARIFSPAFL